jgi:hypothetical protein
MCSCGAPNPDGARFCGRCGNQMQAGIQQQPGAPPPGMSYPPPYQPYQPAPVPPKPSNAGKIIGIVVGVILLLGVIGVIGVALFVRSVAKNPEVMSTFQQSFDNSFKKSCQDAAISKGAARPAAESYCECALGVFKQTHSTDKAAASCKQNLLQ